uniref:Uncharacterized protein n=1 Tax=Ananas comosus var. bracteatus TaxID=296719 RepID=A0A6V7NJY6_ANACO|nr:unnamed protein product [Ananas comosus var. bracteatus]
MFCRATGFGYCAFRGSGSRQGRREVEPYLTDRARAPPTADDKKSYIVSFQVDNDYAKSRGGRYTGTGSGDEVELVWKRWSDRKDRIAKRTRLTELVGCWWTIWKVRNDLIFRNRLPNPGIAVHRLKILVKEWESSLST